MKKIIVLSLTLLISSCAVFQKNKTIQNKKDIIIIGAGIAGLSAANYLKEKGHHPIVLEAQEAVGGRIKTNRSLEIAFDEGASWIHGKRKNPITKLARQAGMETALTQDDLVKVYDIDGQVYSTQELEKEEALYEILLETLPANHSESFAHVFYKNFPQYNNNRLWTYMLSAFLEFDTGGDINQLSSNYFYDDKAFKGTDHIATNGYDRIPRYLAKNLDIRLNTSVKSIDYSKNKLKINTNNGSYTADMVLLTVPLGVLKKRLIKFSPPLPKATQNAIDQLKMGNVNKFFLLWDEVFWDSTVDYLGYTPEEKGMFNYFLNLKKISDVNALVSFSFGEYSITTEAMSDEEIISEIMKHLKTMYGNHIPNPSKILRTKWNSNPYAFGAYSFTPKNASSASFKVFEQAIANKLFFAGEHTSQEYRGTVHGAYLSGIREAKKMLEN